MKLLILVLSKTECLDQVLEALNDVGISGATIIDTVGMGRTLSKEEPMVGDLKLLEEKGRLEHKTIFTVIKGEKKVEEAIKTIDHIVGGLDNPNTGILFVLPVEKAFGLTERK